MSLSKFMLAKEYTPTMKLPKRLENYSPPVGWKMSEKLDKIVSPYMHN